MGRPGELTIDAVLTEITNVGDGDMARDASDRLIAEELSNRREGHVVQASMQLRNGYVGGLIGMNRLPIKISEVVRSNGRRKLNSACLTVHPFTYRVLRDLRVGSAMVPGETIWREETRGEGGNE